MIIHPLALFAVDKAQRLISSGGAHAHDNIHDATQEVLDAIMDAHQLVTAASQGPEPGETMQ